jgi:hypothetical protein
MRAEHEAAAAPGVVIPRFYRLFEESITRRPSSENPGLRPQVKPHLSERKNAEGPPPESHKPRPRDLIPRDAPKPVMPTPVLICEGHERQTSRTVQFLPSLSESIPRNAQLCDFDLAIRELQQRLLMRQECLGCQVAVCCDSSRFTDSLCPASPRRNGNPLD